MLPVWKAPLRLLWLSKANDHESAEERARVKARFVTPLAGLLFLPRLPPPKLDKESSSGPTGVDCGLLDAMPNSLTATTKQALLKRSLEPRSATTRNFETFTTRLKTPSCKLTSTKLFQSANRNFTKTWQRLALTTKAKLCTRTSFLTVLSQRAVADFTPKQAAGFPYCCLSSWRLSLRLHCSLTKGCAGKLSSNTKLRTWMPLTSEAFGTSVKSRGCLNVPIPNNCGSLLAAPLVPSGFLEPTHFGIKESFLHTVNTVFLSGSNV